MRFPSRCPLPAPVLVLLLLPLASPAPARAQLDIPFGETVAAVVPTDQAATFIVPVAEAGFLSVVVRSLDDVDVSLAVADPDGQALPNGTVDMDYGGNFGDERIVVLTPRAGDYRVLVSTLGSESSRIEVGASFIASSLAATGMDPDGRPSDALALEVGDDHEDTLSPGDSRDWYRIMPTTDGVLTILTRAASGDLVLEVYAEGEYVEPMERSDQDQNGVSGNEAVTVDVTAGTPLYVRVLPFMEATETIEYRIASGLVGG